MSLLLAPRLAPDPHDHLYSFRIRDRSLSFRLRGALVVDLQHSGYGEAAEKARIVDLIHDVLIAVSQRWTLRDGKMHGGPWPALSVLHGCRLTFEQPAVLTALCRSTCALDEALHHFCAVLWDPLLLYGSHPRTCPVCSATGALQSNAMSIEPKVVKGLGHQDLDCVVHTRRWLCTSASHGSSGPKNFQDTDAAMLNLLPQHQRAMAPLLHQTVSASFTPMASMLYDSFSGNGVSTEHMTTAVNDMRLRGMAIQQLENLSRHRAVAAGQQAAFKPPPAVGQPLNKEQYPVQHNSAYVGQALSALQEEQVDYCDRLMASKGGRLLCIDAGMKNPGKVRSAKSCGSAKVCSAVHTVVNEAKEVIGQWCGSNSTKQLAAALLDLRRRFERLPNNALFGQCWWMDDEKLYRSVIGETMEGRVGVGLHPGDSGMKEDAWHGAETFDGILQPGHSMRQQVKSLFYQVFFIDDAEDLANWIAAREHRGQADILAAMGVPHYYICRARCLQ